MKKGTGAMLVALGLTGCAYQVQPVQVTALNIYSIHDDKIPGRFALVIDPTMRQISRDIKPSSHMCSAHTFPLSIGESLAGSTRLALESIFESVVEMTSAVPTDEGVRGTIVVRLDSFSPTLRCTPGFWSGQCTATTEIALGTTIRTKSESLFASSVVGQKTADADSGSACDGGAQALGQSISGAMRDALERMGERLSHSPRLRGNAGK